MKTIVLVSITITLLCTSCSHFTLADANQFHKGMSINEVAATVSRSPENTFEISLPSKPTIKYFVEQYEISFGDYKSVYFVVYEGGKMLYWGYPLEFNRHPDALLNEIGRTATAAYDRIK